MKLPVFETGVRIGLDMNGVTRRGPMPGQARHLLSPTRKLMRFRPYCHLRNLLEQARFGLQIQHRRGFRFCGGKCCFRDSSTFLLRQTFGNS